MAVFLLTIVLVNPFWNTAYDDDWAYTLTVRHLLETGSYELHDWAAANMPFQIYWGALFALSGGNLHASLRLSTLALWAIGLISFYGLALEHRFAPRQAAALTLVLLSSPLAMKLSFSFMTDVPYLSGVLLALWLYTRALRANSVRLMFLASVAAAAAILVRQFGVTLIAGLVLTWLVNRARFANWKALSIGLLLPIMAAGWQLQSTVPGVWGVRYNVYRQWRYLQEPWTLLGGVASRPGVILQYLAIFTVPLVLLLFFDLLRGRREGRPEAWWARLALLCLPVSLAWLWGYASGATPLLMPLLDWNFWILNRLGDGWRAALTAGTIIGGALLVPALLARYKPSTWNSLSPPAQLLDMVALCTVLLHLVFWKLGDDYLLPLVPYAVIVAGSHARDSLQRHFKQVLAVTLLVAALSAAWTRSSLSFLGAEWKAADMAQAMGARPGEVHSSWEWECYHGFAEIRERVLAAPISDSMQVFSDWCATRAANARFIVARSPRPGWETLAEVPYTPLPFWHRTRYLLRRDDRGRATAASWWNGRQP